MTVLQDFTLMSINEQNHVSQVKSSMKKSEKYIQRMRRDSEKISESLFLFTNLLYLHLKEKMVKYINYTNADDRK